MAPGNNGFDVRLPNEQAVLARMRGTQDRIADAITTFAGTMQFVYIHAAWFTVWIAFNEGPQNWQSLWTCAAYIVLGVTLLRPRAVAFAEAVDTAPAVAMDPRI